MGLLKPEIPTVLGHAAVINNLMPAITVDKMKQYSRQVSDVMKNCDAIAKEQADAQPEALLSKAECRKMFDDIKKACAVVKQTADNLVSI